MEKKRFFTIRNISLTAVLAALIFVLTKFVSIPIPSPLGRTALSVGNAMCILSALLFGPLTGGLAAGLGNALVDLTDPTWAADFWMTFINKFLMTFVAGLIMHNIRIIPENLRTWLAGLGGTLTYCLLYVTKNILSGVLVRGFTWQVSIAETVAVKLPTTLVNGVIAMVCAALLYPALKRPLKKAHMLYGGEKQGAEAKM